MQNGNCIDGCHQTSQILLDWINKYIYLKKNQNIFLKLFYFICNISTLKNNQFDIF
jgi:hypothetical protein